MKKLLQFSIIFFLITAFVSCGPSKEEQMLNGVWTGQITETDDDGDEINYGLTLQFDYENAAADIILDLSYPGIGTVATVEMHGDWMADEDEITYFLDEDLTSVSFNNNIRILCGLLGVTLHDLEDSLTSMLVGQMGFVESMKIYSLSPSTLRVDFDGAVTLHKKGNIK